MPPTGGPPDRTPPVVAEIEPPADAVNVQARSIRLVFSEYVDAASFAQAFSLTPAVEGRLDFSWRGRSVAVSLPEPLRENTTYIVSLDTQLRDARGVALEAPITVAFSTGPRINRGRIAGQVVEAERGQGLPGIDVYAYAAPDATLPDSLPERPDYRTQTDQRGHFQLDYLSEQPYYVIALEDLNRNRRPDAQERFAVPPHPFIAADTTEADADLRWVMTALDTIPPVLQRVRTLSSRRLALRFSEPVRLASRSTEAWVLRDSLRDRAVPVEEIYTLPEAPQEVYLLTDSLQATPHQLRPAAVADSSGNRAASRFHSFTPSPAPDTLRTRFLSFAPDTFPPNEADVYVLLPGQAPGVRFNQPLPDALLEQAVTVQDTTGQAQPFTAHTPDGTTYRLSLEPPLAPGQIIRIAVDGRLLGGQDTTYTRTFQRIPERELGARSGVVTSGDTSGTVVVELHPTGPSARAEPYRQRLDEAGRYSFTNLPEGRYRLRTFVDRNDNLRWDGGRLSPYQPAEPIAWGADSLDVRPRWDQVAEDTLRISSP